MKRFAHPATILALAALVFSTAGGAVAARELLIPGSQIKPHSIPLTALSPAAVRALRGQQGAPGPAGAAGSFDPTKVSRVVGGSITINPGQTNAAAANCPAGSVLIGGGGSAGIAGLDISAPAGSPPVQWLVATSDNTSVPVTLQAYAICAAP